VKSNRRNPHRHANAIPLLVAGLLLCAGPAAAEDGNATLGKALAVKWCSACHIVTDDQTKGSADVPSFRSIASRPDFSEDAVVAYLSTSHPTRMPDMNLSRTELADVAAYIASLR